MLSGPKCAAAKFGMGDGRGRDGDGINVGPRQHGFEVCRELGPQFGGEGVNALFIGVADQF